MKCAATFALGLMCVLSVTTASAQGILDVVKTGTPEQVRALVAKDASLVNAKDAGGDTPLHHVATGGSAAMAELLISLGAAVDSVNTGGRTPLHVAIGAKKPEVALVLIAKGADARKRMGSGAGSTPLHLAAWNDVDAVVGPLVAKGADLESPDQFSRTPLQCAVSGPDNVRAARALIDKGANVNATGANGITALDLAIHGSSILSIELLLERGATCTAEKARSILQVAAASGTTRLFRAMVDKHGDSLFIDAASNRATMNGAVVGGSVEIVKALLARNIPIDSRADGHGWTLLHRVAESPQGAGVIELLVKNGFDINARALDGRTAFNIAGGLGNQEARRVLVALGANQEPQTFPVLTGPYLGQTPPSGAPIPFARGMVIDNHGGITVSPDGREMYWSATPSRRGVYRRNRIFMTRQVNGRWTVPEVAPFSLPITVEWMDDSPFVSPDNRRVFFISTRPAGSAPGGKENIWFVERTAAGWSPATPLGPEVNALTMHWQISVSNTGTLYFGGVQPGDIYYSRFLNGKHAPAVSAGPLINSSGYEDCPFIAPDESYLIFNRFTGPERGLHISYRLKDGQWSQPAALKQLPAGPTSFVSPDGRYVFFGYPTSWAPAGFIQELKLKDLK